MKVLQLSIRQIGNSRGVVIPKPVLAQLGLERQAEMTVERGAIVLRKPTSTVRGGWSEAARLVAAQTDSGLLMGEFGNEGDSELVW